jgi:hypothetical protein
MTNIEKSASAYPKSETTLPASVSESKGGQRDPLKQLSLKHLQMLQEGSGISQEVIRARGYRTVEQTSELTVFGFAPSQQNSQQIPGLLLPVHTTDGGNGLYVYRCTFRRKRSLIPADADHSIRRMPIAQSDGWRSARPQALWRGAKRRG